MNVYIDYLPKNERDRLDYLGAKKLAKAEDELREFDEKDPLLDYLRNKNLNEVKFISINSHGFPNPACFTNSKYVTEAIGYRELVETLNTTIGGENLILNLVGICQSSSIEYYLRDLDEKFREVWISDENTPSCDATFRLIHDGDFDYYVELKELPLRRIIRL